MVGLGFADEIIDITPTLRRIPDISPNVGTGSIVPSRVEPSLVTDRDWAETVIAAGRQQGMTDRQLRRWANQNGITVPVTPEGQQIWDQFPDLRDDPEIQELVRAQDRDAIYRSQLNTPMSNAGGVLDTVSTGLDLGAMIANASGRQIAAGLLSYAGAITAAALTGFQIGDVIRRELGRAFPGTFLYPEERWVPYDGPQLVDDYEPGFDGQCRVKYEAKWQINFQSGVTWNVPDNEWRGMNIYGPLGTPYIAHYRRSGRDYHGLFLPCYSAPPGDPRRVPIARKLQSMFTHQLGDNPSDQRISFQARRMDGLEDNCGFRYEPMVDALDTMGDILRGLPGFNPLSDSVPTGDNPAPVDPRLPNPFPNPPEFPDFDYPENEPSGDENPFIPTAPPYLPHTPSGPIVSPRLPRTRGGGGGSPVGSPIGTDEPTGNPNPDYDVRDPSCCIDPGIGRILELLRGIEESLKLSGIRLDLENCEGDGRTTINSGENFTSQFALISQALGEIWDKVKCPLEVNAVLPEIFLSKSPKIKPQCKITYANEGSSWALTIPQFNEAYKDSINLSSYQKGNVMCVLDLLDNSSITLNAISEGEGVRVIGELVQYVLPQFVPSDWISRIKITKYNRNLSTKKVTPKQAKYWSEGDMRSVSDWIRKLT